MSKFYTNLVLLGDDILYRGYEHGQPVQYRDRSSPVLFFVPKAQTKPTKFKTLDGRRAYKKQFSGAREAREVLKQYETTCVLELSMQLCHSAIGTIPGVIQISQSVFYDPFRNQL